MENRGEGWWWLVMTALAFAAATGEAGGNPCVLVEFIVLIAWVCWGYGSDSVPTAFEIEFGGLGVALTQSEVSECVVGVRIENA